MNGYYFILFFSATLSGTDFKTDMELLKGSLDLLATKTEAGAYKATVGFEKGKKRLVAVHMVVDGLDLERFILYKNRIVYDYEDFRFWHRKKVAVLRLKTADDVAKYRAYVPTVCDRTEDWGEKSDGKTGAEN